METNLSEQFREAAETKYPMHKVDTEIPCISVNDLVREYRQVFVEACLHRQPEVEELKALIEKAFYEGYTTDSIKPPNLVYDEFIQKHGIKTR